MAEVKQKIISCPNHHFYDANKYQSCPYCAGGTGNFQPTIDPYSGSAVGGTAVGGATVPPTVGTVPGADVGYQGGPTMPPEMMENPAAGKMSQTVFVDDSTPTGVPSPVVGWLVSLAGPCRGTDYRIHTGYNYIGREYGDVVINGDMAISADKDSAIAYVAKLKRFYIAHEQGKNVLMVNDVPVMGGSTELHSHDRITIGNTQLIFIALCGEEFSWSDAE